MDHGPSFLRENIFKVGRNTLDTQLFLDVLLFHGGPGGIARCFQLFEKSFPVLFHLYQLGNGILLQGPQYGNDGSRTFPGQLLIFLKRTFNGCVSRNLYPYNAVIPERKRIDERCDILEVIIEFIFLKWNGEGIFQRILGVNEGFIGKIGDITQRCYLFERRPAKICEVDDTAHALVTQDHHIEFVVSGIILRKFTQLPIVVYGPLRKSPEKNIGYLGVFLFELKRDDIVEDLLSFPSPENAVLVPPLLSHLPFVKRLSHLPVRDAFTIPPAWP